MTTTKNIRMETQTHKRNSYTIAKKIEVIKAYETKFNFNASRTANEFNIDLSMIYRWIQNKDKIMKTKRSVRTQNGPSRKVGAYPELEQALYKWVVAQRAKNCTIKRHKLKDTAKQIANKLGINTEGFGFSGWSRGFMSRFNISNRAQQNLKSVEDSKKIITKFLQQCRHSVSLEYKQEYVYYMDEAPIYFDISHGKTLAPIGLKSIDILTSVKEKTDYISLTITASGQLLPAYLLFDNLKKVPKLSLPDNVIVNVNKSG